MTPEEAIAALYRTLDQFDREYANRVSAESQLRKERETHAREISDLKTEVEKEKSGRRNTEAEIRALAKDNESLAKENEALRKELEDRRNKNATSIRNTFGSKSRRSRTAVGKGLDNSDRSKGIPHAFHKGAEASCVIRSVIETCKLWGKSVFDYLRSYFNAIALGRTDYDNLMPWNIQTGC